MSASDSAPTTDALDLPVIDLAPLLACQAAGQPPSAAALAEAEKAAQGLHRHGLLIVRDPRASSSDNDAFLDLLEAYFEQPEPAKLADVRSELFYQVGTTPSRVELPRNHCDRMRAFAEADAPLSLCPPEKDPKWRFFWRVGQPPQAGTAFPQLNAAPVVPAAFPGWAGIMDSWGSKLLGAAESVASLAALGFGLPADSFSSLMAGGPHLLAPTASDFSRFGAVGTVLAGFHADLNFITAHGRSRYPGLYVWTREGRRAAVKIPEGCLLVQAGLQFQHLTGGHVLAGFHEVVVSSAAEAAIAAAKASPGRSLWRISSTLFAHIASDVQLQPLAHFATEEARAAYPPTFAGDQVAAELAAINLGEGSDGSSAAQ
jgi:isopenicillin N synthase-like dioxygenase